MVLSVTVHRLVMQMLDVTAPCLVMQAEQETASSISAVVPASLCSALRCRQARRLSTSMHSRSAAGPDVTVDRPDMQADQAAVRSSLQHIDQRIHRLRDLAQEICHLLGFVSLNMRVSP